MLFPTIQNISYHLPGKVKLLIMNVDRNYLEKLRQKADIVEVISSYLKLRKSGKNYVGLCPFHNERTPSFTVSKDRGLYHCFGCGVGGNVFTFVMEMEKIAFNDAARMLARRFNITFPSSVPSTNKFEKLFQANLKIASFYNEMLKKHSQGKAVLDYLSGRGIKDESVEKFHLGYSPPDSILAKKYTAHELELDTLLKLGLVVQRDTGLEDVLRDRLVIPIYDHMGRIVGFAGRSLREDLMPKYLNIGETALFKKSKILYGLSQGKNSISKNKKAILVEGYFDVISLHQSGFSYAVSTMGTSLTLEQVDLLKRWVDEVILMFDLDEGGKAATMRSIDLLKGLDIKVKVLSDYGEKDPDELLRARGNDILKEMLNQTVPAYEFIWKNFIAQSDLGSIEGKSSFIRMVSNYLADSKNPTLVSEYIRRMSEITRVKEELLLRELERIKRKGSSTVESITQLIGKISGKEKLRQEIELYLLSFLLKDTESFLKISEGLSPEEITNHQLKGIFEKVLKIVKEEGILPLSSMNKVFTEEEIALTSRLLIDDKFDLDFVEVKNMIRKFRQLKNEVDIENLKTQIKQTEVKSDFEEQRKLLVDLRYLMELNRELKK